MKDKKILFGTFITLLLLLTTGLSYAWFSASISGNENAKNVVVEAGTLSLVYTDGPEIKAQNIKPGWSTTKEVSVKNTGTLEANYNIIWQSLTNEITNNEMIISATCERLNSTGTTEGTCNTISESAISSSKISTNISIESGITHKYTFTILFKETNADQNYNQGKNFSGVLGINEYTSSTLKLEPIKCYTENKETPTQGLVYETNQYTYAYQMHSLVDTDDDGTTIVKWENDNDTNSKWSVRIKDINSTSDLTENICAYINDEPVTSAYAMYGLTQAKKIDVSSFDTSNVIDMSYMFTESNIEEIIGLDNFNTSKVTNMEGMFNAANGIQKLELSNFDTSNVINMSGMFCNSSNLTSLDLSSFDTSNVTNMEVMFAATPKLTVIYASEKFVITNVKDGFLGYLFSDSVNLKGGAGTTYDDSKVGKEYARIDGGPSNPGYFTAK